MKSCLLLIFITLSLFGTIASAATLRLHIPMSTTWTGNSLSDGQSVSSSGYSLRGIFGLIGAGYTSSSMKYKFTGGANTYTSNAVDISITPIDLLTVGYGSVIGAALGALIFGVVQQGLFFANVESSLFRVFLGVILLFAVILNTYIRRIITGEK